MRYPFDSEEAQELNKKIFETIYYFALKVYQLAQGVWGPVIMCMLQTSCELAKELGPYETYEGSPVSKGELQHDMWGVEPTDLWDWKELKEEISK